MSSLVQTLKVVETSGLYGGNSDTLHPHTSFAPKLQTVACLGFLRLHRHLKGFSYFNHPSISPQLHTTTTPSHYTAIPHYTREPKGLAISTVACLGPSACGLDGREQQQQQQ